MPCYFVETYLARGDAGRRSELERLARSAALEQTRTGVPVRFAGAIHLPEDETCFFAFDAGSSTDAALVAQRAGLEPFRIGEAISSREENPKWTE